MKGGRKKTMEGVNGWEILGAFPDGNSALMLAAARLRQVASSHWGTRRYIDRLKRQDVDAKAKEKEEGQPAVAS